MQFVNRNNYKSGVHIQMNNQIFDTQTANNQIQKPLNGLKLTPIVYSCVNSPHAVTQNLIQLLHSDWSIAVLSSLSFTFRVPMVPLLYIYCRVQYGLGPVAVHDHYNETTVSCGMCRFYCYTGSLFRTSINSDNEMHEEEIL